MKKVMFAGMIIICCFISCRKFQPDQISANSYSASIQEALKDSMSETEFRSLNFGMAQQIHVDSAQIHLLRIPLIGRSVKNEFFSIKTDQNGGIEKARYISIYGGDVTNGANVPSFNGSFTTRGIGGKDSLVLEVVNGNIENPLNRVQMLTGYNPHILPEVVVYGTTGGNGGSTGDLYNLLSMLGNGEDNYWANYYTTANGVGGTSGGGGGGGNVEHLEPPVALDFEYPEDAESINISRYVTCFANVPNAGAIYSITISSDIPIDTDPSKIFNWTESSFGHSFIELHKEGTDGSSVTRSVGFYPNASFKTIGGNSIQSKMVDNAGHEFNARYTIPVNASQFLSALVALETLSTNAYNLFNYNCTDYALGVFNAAGGNLTIPKYSFPGAGVTASNTPQGLYMRIKQISEGGVINAQASSAKNYAPNSGGPCN